MLHCVDWDVIVVYTCANVTKCLPNFAQDQYYLEEYAFVQFSKDFDLVSYGSAEQVRANKKVREEQLQKI